jgi:hypothetical protein
LVYKALEKVSSGLRLLSEPPSSSRIRGLHGSNSGILPSASKQLLGCRLTPRTCRTGSPQPAPGYFTTGHERGCTPLGYGVVALRKGQDASFFYWLYVGVHPTVHTSARNRIGRFIAPLKETFSRMGLQEHATSTILWCPNIAGRCRTRSLSGPENLGKQSSCKTVPRENSVGKIRCIQTPRSPV